MINVGECRQEKVAASVQKSCEVGVDTDMKQDLTAHEVAEVVGISYESFRKNPYHRRPPIQDDGTYRRSDVVAWQRARLARREAWQVWQVKVITARIAREQAELEHMKALIMATSAAVEKVNELSVEELPFITHRIGSFRPEEWFANGPITQPDTSSARVVRF